MMFVFSYTQNGVKALESFREDAKDIEHITDEQNLQLLAKSDTEN